MQQFIYSNVNHSGYAYLTAGSGIFSDSRKAQTLRQTSQIPHANLKALEHQSYMLAGITSGTSAARRLVLQAACSDPYRNGVAFRGYVADVKEVSGGGPEFIRFLRTRFEPTEDILAVTSGSSLGAIGIEDVPIVQELASRDLPRDARVYVIRALLEGKRIAIRLPEIGSAAMQASRQIILGIYERLPYRLRVNTGFFTGGSAALWNKESSMPSDVRIMLLDNDADTANNSFERFWDCSNPPASTAADDPDYQELLDFLADSDREQLSQFFDFVQEHCGSVENHAKGYFPYILCLKLWKKTAISDSIQYQFAVLLRQKWRDEQSKPALIPLIAEAIPVSRMASYLDRRITRFEDCLTLGQEDIKELRLINSTTDNVKQQDSDRDVNCAVSLFLADKLYTEEEKSCLIQQVGARFSECLETENPKLFSSITPAALYAIHDLLQPMKDVFRKASGRQTSHGEKSFLLAMLEGIVAAADAEESKVWQAYQASRMAGTVFPQELAVSDASWKDAYSQTKTYAKLLLRAEGISDDRVRSTQRILQAAGSGDILVSFPVLEKPVSLQWLEEELDACSTYDGSDSKELMLLRYPTARAWLAANAADIDSLLLYARAQTGFAADDDKQRLPASGILLEIVRMDQSFSRTIAEIYANKTKMLGNSGTAQKIVSSLYHAGCSLNDLKQAETAAKNKEFSTAAEQLLIVSDPPRQEIQLDVFPAMKDRMPFAAAFLSFVVLLLLAVALPAVLLCIEFGNASEIVWIAVSAAMLILMIFCITAAFVSKARPRKGLFCILSITLLICSVLCVLATISLYQPEGSIGLVTHSIRDILKDILI